MRLALGIVVVGLALTACTAGERETAPLARIDVTDSRYRGLVFLVATVRKSGPDFVITNDSTQPWFDVTVALADDGADDYLLRIDEVDAGQTVRAASSDFMTSRGFAFDAQRVMPSTLIVSAEIGEGGPTGVYAVRL